MSDPQQVMAALCARVGVREPEGWRGFLDLARSWNERTDLTSARSDVELAEVLFLDAAHLIRAGWIQAEAALLDVGAGVGAPTIPLVLAVPSLTAVLVEPRRIRAAFLRTASGALGIPKRLTVREQRLDTARPSIPGAPFDVALSRATFAPESWLRIGAALATEIWVFAAGGKVEGPANLQLERELRYEVPSSGAPRAIFAYRRQAPEVGSETSQ
ncbi:MAG: class I SAM-dependent methyltransferase [Myxococcales bacterium]|jgi:16S rRNA (guanine527-N7)-methyltransferase